MNTPWSEKDQSESAAARCRRGTGAVVRHGLLAVLLLGDFSGATLAQEPERKPPGKLRVFWGTHGKELLIALGIDQVGHYYSSGIGSSTDPLILKDPPGIDVTVRDWLRDPDPRHPFMSEHGNEVLKYSGPIVLAAMGLTDRPQMVPDLMGYLETYLVVGGLTDLLKSVVGRERPELEFVDEIAEEDDLSPEEIEEILEKEDNRRSFPSGHASGSFAYASYLERAIARRTGMRGPARVVSFSALYAYAGYIGCSRLRNDKHYLSDVVAGAALGVWVGRTWYRINHRDEFPKHGKDQKRGAISVRLNPPVAVPGGLSLMVTLAIRRPAPSQR